MEFIVTILGVLLGILKFSSSQRLPASHGNPLSLAEFLPCGETLYAQAHASRTRLQNQAFMQSRQQVNSIAQAQAQVMGPVPVQHNAVFQARPQVGMQVFEVQPNPYRVKRQAMRPAYQPAFVPDLNQRRRISVQTNPTNPRPLPRATAQQSFLSPQLPQPNSRLQSLLLAMDPPDAPDLPDVPTGGVAAPTSGTLGQPGPGRPQPGPQINQPAGVQSPSSPPLYAPQHFGPQPPARMPLPIPIGLDGGCYCIDMESCLLGEGSIEVYYRHQCVNRPPPGMSPMTGEPVCCCFG